MAVGNICVEVSMLSFLAPSNSNSPKLGVIAQGVFLPQKLPLNRVGSHTSTSMPKAGLFA
jgi:hypothetical protein